MADFLSRLIIDNKDYVKGLGDAKRAMHGFAEDNKNFSNIVTNCGATLGKLAGGLGVAMSAGEVFNQMMQNSQSFGDKMNVSINSVKSSVNEFFYALGTGDFSNFLNGINNIIEKAAEAERSLDQLGNTKISYSFVRGENRRAISTARTRANNKDLSANERGEGFKNWGVALEKSKADARNLESDVIQAVKDLSAKNTKLNNPDIEAIKEIARLDITNKNYRTAEKDRLSDKYSEYKEEEKKLIESQTRRYNQSGKSAENYFKSQKEMNDLATKYSDAILYNNLLVRKNDEEWQSIVNMLVEADNATEELGSQTEEYLNALREFKNSSNTISKQASVPQNKAGSLASIDAQIKEASTLYAEVTSNAARAAALKTLNELKARKKELEFMSEHPNDPGFVKRERVSFASMAKMPDLNAPFKKTEGMDNWTDKMGDASLAVENMNSVLTAMQGITSSLGDNPLAGIFASMGSIMTVIPQLMALTTGEAALGAAKLPFPASLVAIGTVFSTIASLFSQLSYADGGIVPGSNFHDGIRANVSSGEMFINQHDQSKLFKAIKTGSFGGGGGVTRVSGEQLILAINNSGKRTGKGTLVFK